MNAEEKIDALAESSPAVAWLLENGDDVRGSHFLTDVRNKLLRYGSLTDRQIAAVDRSRESVGRRKEDDAKRAALAASGVRAPEGQNKVCGEIVSVKQTNYGFGAVVNTDGGWRVWFRLPASLLRALDGDERAAKGRRVSFVATLTRSDRDPLFAFAKRPSSAAFI